MRSAFDAGKVLEYLTVLRSPNLQLYALHCASSLWLNILYAQVARHDAYSDATFACLTG